MNAYKVKTLVCTRSCCPDDPHQDFSEGVRYMKQLKKTETGIEGNLNVMTRAYMHMWNAVVHADCRLYKRSLAACCGISVYSTWTRKTGLSCCSFKVLSPMYFCVLRVPDGQMRVVYGVQCSSSSLHSADGRKVALRL